VVGTDGVVWSRIWWPWLRSYLHRDERVHNTALRNRLVDMIAVVRQSGSLAELDQMQKEAFEILRDTLNCFEDGALVPQGQRNQRGCRSAFTLSTVASFVDSFADDTRAIHDRSVHKRVRVVE
jgi:hypothetical protein